MAARGSERANMLASSAALRLPLDMDCAARADRQQRLKVLSLKVLSSCWERGEDLWRADVTVEKN